MSIFSRASSSLQRVLMGGPSHLRAGNHAPELGVMSTDGVVVNVAELRGQPWVLYFYPKDETPGCTAQACDLRDSWERITARGVKVYGCSLDGVDAHKKFIQHHELPFPLLADTQGVVAERYGVLGGIGPVKMARRVTFVVNAEGQITHIFDPARTKGHAQEVLDALSEGAPV